MANSAFFGRRRRVSDPLQAVQLLGLNTVKALVLSAYAFGAYEKRGRTPGFSLERLQAHSVMTGAFARVIAAAERAPEQMLDDASVAALLHDIGTLILAATLPAKYGRALDLAAGREIPIHDAEMEDLRRDPRRGRRVLCWACGPSPTRWSRPWRITTPPVAASTNSGAPSP